MPAFHKPIVILGASLSWALAGFGCGPSSSGGDDDDPGSVLGGGAGGTTGGAATSGGTGGGTSGGKGGTGGGSSGGSGGSGNCTAAGDSYQVVDSMPDGSCCAGLTTSCALTNTTDPMTGITRSNGMCACEDGSVGGSGTGGAGGTGGTTGGTGGAAAGTGGSAGMPGSGVLGSGCGSDGDCASGLVCVTETGGMLDVGSPGGGLCTLACTGDAECMALAPGSYCVAFDEAQTITYCLEGCVTGEAGEPKCNGRADFACGLLGLIPGSTMCTTSDDCLSTELCATGETPQVCGEIVTGCVPNCGGDHDCASGDFCDFSTGLCVPDAPGGQAIGTPCDPNATTDVCSGFCTPTDEAGIEGVCSAFCTFADGLLGCGWDGTTVPDAGCLFLTRLSPDLGVGDLGICGSLCDCNDDCQASTQRCIDDSGGEVMTIWGRAGYCRALQAGETEADTIACQ